MRNFKGKPKPRMMEYRYAATLPCKVWLELKAACERYIKRTPRPSQRFAVLPTAVKVIERHTADASPDENVSIEGNGSTFTALSELCMVEECWSVGRQLVSECSRHELRTQK